MELVVYGYVASLSFLVEEISLVLVTKIIIKIDEFIHYTVSAIAV